MPEKPEVYFLSEVPWQFWCTLTFKSERLPERVRQALFFALMRTVAKWGRVHFKKLLWVRRAEFGEITARLHLHSLIGGLPETMVTQHVAFAIKNKWTGLGGGIARVYVYDKSLRGLWYTFKDTDWDPLRAAQFEANKFGDSSTSVTFSESVLRLLARRRRQNPRTCGEHGPLRTVKN